MDTICYYTLSSYFSKCGTMTYWQRTACSLLMNNPLNEVYYKCMLLKAIYKVSHFLIGIYKWREDCEFSGITLATVCAHTVLIKCICFHFQELLRYMWNHTRMLYTSSDLWITQTIPSHLGTLKPNDSVHLTLTLACTAALQNKRWSCLVKV